eukprot:8781173-Pyramimonas_sp.AAC.2
MTTRELHLPKATGPGTPLPFRPRKREADEIVVLGAHGLQRRGDPPLLQFLLRPRNGILRDDGARAQTREAIDAQSAQRPDVAKGRERCLV